MNKTQILIITSSGGLFLPGPLWTLY